MKTKLDIWNQLIERGFHNLNNIFYNLSTPALYEQAVRRREGLIAHLGPLVTRTGQHTGRSPNDKFIVKEPGSDKDIWWGKINRSIDEEHFNVLYAKMLAYAENKDLYIQDCFAGTDPEFKLPIRVINETDRKSTRLNSSHTDISRMPSSA